MSELTQFVRDIPPMSERAIDRVRQMESLASEMSQTNITTLHVFHSGMYARTVMVPAGVVITGALIKVATLLIIAGTATIYLEDGMTYDSVGYNVYAAAANRKQAFVAHTDTWLTMIFPSDAKDVETVEAQFTDEGHLLLSREQDKNNILVTGE